MITIDPAAILRAALADPGARSELAALVEAAVEAGARRVLDDRDHDGLVGLAGLAALLGCSPAAAKTRAHRDPELAALALRLGARRRWRRSEVTALLESRRKHVRDPRLRAADGGER